MDIFSFFQKRGKAGIMEMFEIFPGTRYIQDMAHTAGTNERRLEWRKSYRRTLLI